MSGIESALEGGGDALAIRVETTVVADRGAEGGVVSASASDNERGDKLGGGKKCGDGWDVGYKEQKRRRRESIE